MADLRYEFEMLRAGHQHIAGLDEAGRGAWAGPVVAAAVILPLDRFDLAAALEGVDDSKQLSAAQRAALLPRIVQVALAVGVGSASNEEIDDTGIVPATRAAMYRALANLDMEPTALLTDAMPMPELDLPYTSLVKGDQKSLTIAAASIVAKVTRDNHMDQLDEIFPHHGFLVHKGYGTALHRQALRTFGPTRVHRMTFAPLQQGSSEA